MEITYLITAIAGMPQATAQTFIFSEHVYKQNTLEIGLNQLDRDMLYPV